MKVLVTGGAGFIGGNLAKKLVESGHNVYTYDLLYGIKYFIEGTHMLRNMDNIPKMDAIFHLGMASSSPMYKDNPHVIEETMKTTIDVLERAKEWKCPVVYASSSSLYNGNVPPFNESMDIHVTDYYTETRLFIERMFELYYEINSVQSTGLRLFSVFGPRDENKGQYANTITQFALEMIRGKKPLIYGDGEQSRDFVHVDLVVNSFIVAMESMMNNEPQYPPCSVINIGTGVETSFNETIKMTNEILGTDIKPDYIDNPIMNYVGRTCADTNIMENVLGVDSRNHDLRERLEKHIKYLKRLAD